MIKSLSYHRELRRDPTKLYNPMPISELSELDPNTPWLSYINKLLTEDIIQVEASERIIVSVPSYIKDLSKLLQETPVRTQANYLMWRAAASSMPYFTEEGDRIGQKFSMMMTGTPEQPPRWKRCVGATKKSLPNAVGSLYVRKYFDEKSKSTAQEMVTEIRKQINLIIEQVDWMDDRTKERAKVKAQVMVEHIGYPAELLDMKTSL